MSSGRFVRACLAAFVISALAAPLPALAQAVVRIEHEGELGHGLAVSRAGDCFVVTARHVVGDAFEVNALVPLRGAVPLALQRTAEVLVTLPDGTEVREDLALLKVEGRGDEVCSNNLEAMKNERRSVVTTTDGQGAIDFKPVSLLGPPNEIVLFEFERAGLGQIKSISGAPILWGGKPVGLVVRLSTAADDAQQVGYDIELIAQRFGDWVKGETLGVAKVDQALSVLDRVRKQLPNSDLGQVGALRELARGGGALAGLDLAGFFLDRGRFSSLDFSKSDFTLASLNQAYLDGATLTGAKLNFAVAEDVVMNGADLTESHHEYANYDGGEFIDADFARANAVYATFRGANLSGASFTNANLVYADFTGANVSGADFTGALLNGAVLDDAVGLDSASFSDTSITNMVGATHHTFAEDEVCGFAIDRGGYDHSTIIQRTPSARFSSGYAYDNLLEYTPVSSYEDTPAAWVGTAHYHFLRPCPIVVEAERPVGTGFYDRNQGTWHAIGVTNKLFFDREFLAKRDMKKYIVDRMVERRDAVKQANLARDFVIPETNRDAAVAKHIRGLVPAIRRPTPVCLGSNIMQTSALLARGGRGDIADSMLLDEIVTGIHDSARMAVRVAELAQSQQVSVADAVAWPFGKLHTPGIDADRRGISQNFGLGPKTIEAYRAWKTKALEHAQLNLCFDNPRSRHEIAPGLYVVSDYDRARAWLAAAREKIRSMTDKPDLVGNIGFMSTYSYAVLLYFDEAPDIVRGDDLVDSQSIGKGLADYEQLRLGIDVRAVDVDAENRMIVLRVRERGTETVRLADVTPGDTPPADAAERRPRR